VAADADTGASHENDCVHALSEGDVLAGCRIEAVIGRGGMGVVYRALQLDLQRPVALKVITADLAGDAEFRERFSRESRMAAAIDHPNVVPVYAAGEEAGALYLVMRYVAGSDLHALLLRRGSLPVARAAAIVAQVASALDAAHAAGLVHRDVKPANVLLAAGDTDHAYLSDFGLTRSLDPSQPITDSGQWVGTVDFAAPEQLRGGRVDALSDVYSLGCLLYATLTGAPPFRRATLPATLLAHLHDTPPRPSESGVPEGFDEVVARALAKAPEERYPSAGDLARAALAAAQGVTVRESERTVAVGGAAPDAAPTGRTGVADPPAGAPLRIDDPTLLETNLVAASPAATRLREAPAPTLPVPRRGRRMSRAALAAALALPVAGIATTAALTLGSSDGDGAAAARDRPLAAGEVRAVAEAFADAYQSEDGAALRRLVTSDVRRVLPAGVLRGRDAVATEYESQFRQNATRSYELQNLTVSGGRAGRASGSYRVRRADGTSFGGRIVFGVLRDRGSPRIALIAVTPTS
jgi:ketosteroid isomerase-like protein